MTRLRGDVNNDNTISTLDATAILAHIVKLPSFILTNSHDLEAADANNDNVVSTLDATYILAHIVKLPGFETFAPITPLKLKTISMPNTNTDPVSSWIANQLSVDFTNTDISSTHLLACEIDISGDLTNSILNPYTEDLKPSGTEVTSGTAFDSTFDSYITLGAWSNDAT